MNYEDHDAILKCLKADQEAEEDLRQEIDEQIKFLHHPEGQWEPAIWNDFEGRPRYTFDQMKPAIAKAWAEMAANEYAAETQPVGGGASEDISNIYDGLIRNIYNVSCFDDISTKAGKRMIAVGFGCWRVRTKYIGESFYQDLALEPIGDSHRRVWFDASSEMQTREDANHVHVLAQISQSQAEEKWPKRDKLFESVDSQRSSEGYAYKPQDMVTVGEILYKKPYEKTLYLLSDEEGTVTDDEGLARMEILPGDTSKIVSSRKATCHKVYSRKYDAKDWLEDEKETVFNMLPIIPVYANFDINEGKVTYEGLVRNRMDGQRVFNYVESRKVEESVLAPRAKIFMDNRVAQGYEDELAELNRDPRAVQLFNGAAADKIGHSFGPMQQLGGATVNPALSELSQDMIRNMQLTSGLPNELEMAQTAAKDSNWRFDQRNSMGQLGTFEYYRGQKVALEYTAKVILNAIPKVYDTDRKIRTVDEAGQSSEVRVNYRDPMGKMINDLTAGKYDITIKIGPSFESRQQQANTAILELGDRIPDVLARNTDILASNIDAPGMRQVADRERSILMKQRVIPESQWTDEEREQAQAAAQQQQQPDPATMIAQAELQKSQTEAETARFKALEAQAKLELQKAQQDSNMNIQAIKLEMEKMRNDYQNLRDMAAAAKSLAEAGNTLEQRVVDKAESEI